MEIGNRLGGQRWGYLSRFYPDPLLAEALGGDYLV
jgi:hypothetical protein